MRSPWRAGKGLSYRQVQEQTGLSQQLLYDMEYKDRRLTLAELAGRWQPVMPSAPMTSWALIWRHEMRILIRIVLGTLLVLVALVLGGDHFDPLWMQRWAATVWLRWSTPRLRIPPGPTCSRLCRVPAGEGPFPAVIMLHEFWGLKQEIVGKADALAAEGYVVVAPDMYRGQTTTLPPPGRSIWLLNIPEEQVLGDLEPVFSCPP